MQLSSSSVALSFDQTAGRSLGGWEGAWGSGEEPGGVGRSLGVWGGAWGAGEEPGGLGRSLGGWEGARDRR